MTPSPDNRMSGEKKAMIYYFICMLTVAVSVRLGTGSMGLSLAALLVTSLLCVIAGELEEINTKLKRKL